MEKFCVKGIFGSGMVLQRNRTNCISGFAPAKSSVSVFFREQEWTCTANENGCWKIEFNPGKAGGPFVLEVKDGDESISFSDVWVGEVWLLSGQSNAQLPMERFFPVQKRHDTHDNGSHFVQL